MEKKGEKRSKQTRDVPAPPQKESKKGVKRPPSERVSKTEAKGKRVSTPKKLGKV